MQRRTVVKGMLAGGGLLASSRLVWRASAQVRSQALDEVRVAVERAVERREPVVIVVIPEAQPTDTHAIGFGGFFNCGDENVLAQLAETQLVCLRISEIARLLPDAIVPSGDNRALAALVYMPWRGAELQRFAVLPPTPPVVDSQLRDDFYVETDEDSVEEARVNGPIAAVQRLFRQLSEQALTRSALPVATQLRIFSDRFLAHRIPGSHWQQRTGCGDRIEDPPAGVQAAPSFDCGMGHVPERARRFLNFYVSRRGS